MISSIIKGRDQGFLVLFLPAVFCVVCLLFFWFGVFSCLFAGCFFPKVSVSSTGVSLLAQLAVDELEAGAQNSVQPHTSTALFLCCAPGCMLQLGEAAPHARDFQGRAHSNLGAQAAGSLLLLSSCLCVCQQFTLHPNVVLLYP